MSEYSQISSYTPHKINKISPSNYNHKMKILQKSDQN